MSRGLVAGTAILAVCAGALLSWELWTDSYIAPGDLAKSLALAVFLGLIAGLAWLTRV